MGKQKREPKKNRRPIRQRQRSGGADHWLDELEKRLNVFGASTSDLPELDPESCKSEKQHQHALRVRVRFLSRKIDEIERNSKGVEAERLFGELMTRVELIEDGPAWFVIEKKSLKEGGGEA